MFFNTWIISRTAPRNPRDIVMLKERNTVKPVYNDHLYDKIYYLWFIQ